MLRGGFLQRAVAASLQYQRVEGKVSSKVSLLQYTPCIACQRMYHCTPRPRPGFPTETGGRQGLFPVYTLSPRLLSSTIGDPPSDKANSKEAPASPGGEQENLAAAKNNDRDTIVKVIPKMRKRPQIDYTKKYMDNIYVTPMRAMKDYLLKSSDLEGLDKIIRRSPFPEERSTRIEVYRRSDIEKRANEVWGSAENLAAERQKIQTEEAKLQKDIFKLREAFSYYKRQQEEMGASVAGAAVASEKDLNLKEESIFKSGSGRVVLAAVSINAVNFVIKAGAFMYSGSHSMFAEAIHSFADTLNQLILVFGIQQSIKKPDKTHPYGWSNFRYVASLISGVGIFCLGAGVSWYHGIHGYLHPELVVSDSYYWATVTLLGSFISEGVTLMLALHETQRGAKASNMSFFEFVGRGQDPSVNVVLMEDLAAVVGVLIAGTCMTITGYTGNPLADVVGSLTIGTLLAGVAYFIIHTNTVALVGRSIPQRTEKELREILESDRMVRALHDIKATDMGGKYIRFKAEVDFDGREVTRHYLDSLDLDQLFVDMKGLDTSEDLEMFMLQHGEKIIDKLGEEVDRIEKNLKNKHPEVRHVDLEVL